jgi:hypothetical protein
MFTSLPGGVVVGGQYRDWNILCTQLGQALEGYFLPYNDLMSVYTITELRYTLGLDIGSSPGLKLMERLL